MPIVVVGCNHRSAPLELLERLSVPASGLGDALARITPAVREGLILSTCNRTEIYAATGHAGSGADVLVRILADRADIGIDELSAHAYVHANQDAVSHALRVASGLDSMVLGEDQIQAQWKRALAHARAAGALGPAMERLGAAALSCGKRVRTFTGIGRHAVSLESLAVREVASRLGTLDRRHVLIIGSGESAALIVRHARAAGSARITVMSRALSRAQDFARELRADAAGIDALPDVLAGVDAVFSCTSAPHPVLGADHLSQRVSRRPMDPIVCVDLGMPRDVDASVEAVAGAQVVRLEALSGLADTHRAERRRHVPAAEAIVASETARFLEWQSARGSAAAIAPESIEEAS